MADALGLSVQTIPQYYARLEEKGYLLKFPYGGVEILRLPDGTKVKQVTTVEFQRSA
jgi:Mn-dependent DtxR family transcriptional regulator